MASAGAADACARSRRAIGHPLSQTETMRDMRPLDEPLTGTTVAATLQGCTPSPLCYCPKAVARCRSGSNAPARGRSTRPPDTPFSQHHQRYGVHRGGKIEPAAASEVEITLNRGGHKGRSRFRAQRLLKRPQCVLIAIDLDEKQPADIEAQLAQALTIRRTKVDERAACDDEHRRTWSPLLCKPHQGGHECERRGLVAVGFSADLMQHPTGKPRTRKMPIGLAGPEQEGGRRDWPHVRASLQLGKHVAECGNALHPSSLGEAASGQSDRWGTNRIITFTWAAIILYWRRDKT